MQLTFFAEEPPVSPSPSLDSAKDWQTRVATSCSPLLTLLQGIAPAGWYGRTSPESFQVETDETLRSFWASSRANASPRRKAAGATADSCPASPMPTALPGAALTLSLPVWHSAASVCSLSRILETGDVPPRFFLSAKACNGILRRAEKRGRVLPPHLLAALKAVAEAGTPDDAKKTTPTSSLEPSVPDAAALTTTKRKRTKSSPSKGTSSGETRAVLSASASASAA